MRWRAIAASIVALLAIAVAAILWISSRQPTTKNLTTYSQIDLAPAQQLGWGSEVERTWGFNRPSRTAFALTPDGTKLVFCGLNQTGNTQLYVRRLDEWTAIPIAGTEGARFPILSPEGNMIAFFADGKLMKVSLDRGAPSKICDEPGLSYGASWGSRGLIVYALGESLWEIRDSVGKPTLLLTSNGEKGEYGFRLPHFLPGGEVFLFSTRTSPNDWDNPRVEAYSLRTKERRIILDEGADARYISTGHPIFGRRGILSALPFDVVQLKPAGESFTVLEDVMQSMNAVPAVLQSNAAQFSISESGLMRYVPGGAYPDPMVQLVTVDRTGQVQSLGNEERPYFAPRLSPNGQMIVYVTVGKQNDICLYNIKRKNSQNLTFEEITQLPIWYPDGTKVTYWVKAGNGREKIVNKAADGGGQTETLLESYFPVSPSSWSRDGKTLAYVQDSPATGFDIYLYESGEKKGRPLLNTNYNEGWPDFSPDGRWRAYASNETGEYEVYIRSMQGQVTKISNGCGDRPGPMWGRGARELYYPGPDYYMMVVDIPDKADLKPSVARKVFPIGPVLFWGSGGRAYDVDPEGQLFYATIPKLGSSVPGITGINIIQNWFEELKRLCPTGKK